MRPKPTPKQMVPSAEALMEKIVAMAGAAPSCSDEEIREFVRAYGQAVLREYKQKKAKE